MRHNVSVCHWCGDVCQGGLHVESSQRQFPGVNVGSSVKLSVAVSVVGVAVVMGCQNVLAIEFATLNISVVESGLVMLHHVVSGGCCVPSCAHIGVRCFKIVVKIVVLGGWSSAQWVEFENKMVNRSRTVVNHA